MRFHIGCSFSFRKLKKFIFPFLFGLLAYFFGGSLFGYLNVNADSYTNLNTTFNISYEEIDYSSIQIDSSGHSVKDYLDSLITISRESEYYDVVIFAHTLSPLSESYWVNVRAYLLPKDTYNNTDNYFSYYGEFSNRSYFGLFRPEPSILGYYVGSSFIIHTNSYQFEDYHNSQDYIAFVSCALDNTNCGALFHDTYFSSGAFQLIPSIIFNNNRDFAFNLFSRNYVNASLTNGYYATNNFGIPYYSTFPIKFTTKNITGSSSIYFKTLNINGINYEPGDIVPTYCEIYSLCGPLGPPDLPTYNKVDDLFISNIPKNSLSNFSLNFSMNYYNDNFSDSFTFYPDFYARKNNGSYYSYESVQCSITGGVAYGTYELNGTFGPITCTSDLTSYDYLYLRFRMTSLDTIYNFRYSSTTGYINISPVNNGPNYFQIMDYFPGLSNDFKAIISSDNDLNYFAFKSDNEYTFASYVRRNSDIVSSNVGDVWVYGSGNMSNIMLYNYLPKNSNSSNVYVFMSIGSIVSFEDNEEFTYYDSFNEISTGGVELSYNISIDKYNADSLFEIINNFLNDIEEDLKAFHDLLNQAFYSLPSMVQSYIIIFYTMFLIYLLYILFKR